MNDDGGGEGYVDTQLRLVGYGVIVSGIVAILAAALSTQPRGIVVFGLGGLAVAALVFERTQGGVAGISLGLLVGSVLAWLWPTVGDGGYRFFGLLLVVVGFIYTAILPRFYRFGQRLGER